MYSNAKHVAPTAVLILILCVLSTDQTLFSRKKSSTPVSPVDNIAQQSKPVPQKETSHWWQMKFKPAESSENSVSNQVAVPEPVPIHQKEIQEHPNKQGNMPRKRLVVKPILHRSFDYRCEIDLIDKELNSDNEYKLIMVYEDNYTTFVINRPLRYGPEREREKTNSALTSTIRGFETYKLQTIFETHFNSDIKWVPCLCPVRKGELVQKHHQQQQQSQPQQHQQQPQKSGSSYYPSSTTQEPSDLSNNDVPRFIFANYPIEA